MSLLKTSLVPFRANPQSCPYIYWGLWASWWLGGLFPCCGNSMKYPNVIVCLRQLTSGDPNAIALCHCSVLVLICSCHSFVFFLASCCALIVVGCIMLYYEFACPTVACNHRCVTFPAKYLTYSSLVSQGGCSRFLVHVIMFAVMSVLLLMLCPWLLVHFNPDISGSFKIARAFTLLKSSLETANYRHL